jgi:hypothetical protein
MKSERRTLFLLFVMCLLVAITSGRASAGQTADLQKSDSASPRFTDNANGTVKDNLTGLIWLKDPNCLGRQSWLNASHEADTLANGACGLTDGSVAGDWRLPTDKEFRSLSSFGQGHPALPSGHPFIGVEETRFYWARPSPRSGVTYWQVNLVRDRRGGLPLYHDSTGQKTYQGSDTAFVWPVRGGQ